MAKAKTKTAQDVDAEKVSIKKPEVKAVEKNNWEFKDRTYSLKGNAPVARMVKSSNIYWFDEEKGYEREMMLTSNQRSVFVDEMQGVKRPEKIIFRDGLLVVPKNKVILQKLLSLYHPGLGVTYEELKPKEDAIKEVDVLELQLEAMNMANDMDIDVAEAVMRVEVGSKVSDMSSKELKRDLLIFARSNPNLFIELANDDNIHLRNVGVKAVELAIIKLSPDNRTFTWASNDRKLLTVPFDEHPYSALAAWFKTDEGMEVFNTIEKKIK